MRDLGLLDRVGVEGTGSYGAGLARHLAREQVHVVEVDRPNRQVRRRHGKTDTVDAIAAARAALARTAVGTPKAGDRSGRGNPRAAAGDSQCAQGPHPGHRTSCTTWC